MAAIKIELEETEKVTSNDETKFETEKETDSQDLDVTVNTYQAQVGLCGSDQNDVPEHCDDRPAETAGTRSRISETCNPILGGIRIISSLNDGKKEKKIPSKADRIRECIQPLQDSLGEESKKKISSILNEVELLSDIEKLLLYLQLPTGAQPDVDPLKQKSPGNPLGKKADAEIAQTYTWIQSHLEEDPEVSLPKQEVYEEYRSFCEANAFEPLCAADFGKVMKHIFPKVKPRRLGTRGNSRYCYSGLRKKLEVDPPMLPDLDISVEDATGKKGAKEDEVASAACHLIMEWAEKLFGKKFATIKDLAGHLLANMYVDNRSVAGFTILSSLGDHNAEKGNQAAAILKQSSGNRRRETQIHLQRKLHEKELIREQKKKLVEQRAQVSRNNSPKVHNRKSHSSKKGPMDQQPNHISNGHENDSNSDKVSSLLSTVMSTAVVSKECSVVSTDAGKSGAVKFEDGWTKTASLENFLKQDDSQVENEKSSATAPSPSATKLIRDDKQDLAKRLTKVPIPRNAGSGNPKVCLPQAVSSIIIVPSVSQVKLTDLGTKTTQSTQRYKRIQPKPVTSRCMRSSLSETSSVFSCYDKGEPSDVLQMDASEKSLPLQLDQAESMSSFQNDNNELCSLQVNLNTSSLDLVLSPAADSNSQFRCGNSLESDPPSGTNASESDELPSSNLLNQLDNSLGESNEVPKIPQSVSMQMQNVSAGLDSGVKCEQDVTVIMNSEVMFPEGGSHSTKRHSEERDSDSVITKKPHLESLLKFEKGTPKITLPTFSKAGLQRISLMMEHRKGHTTDNLSSSMLSVKQEGEREEMSIQQLETDALMEYLHGPNIETLIDNTDPERQVVSDTMINVSSTNTENSPLSEQHLVGGNQTTQLSQLRMLLERNLPQSAARNLMSIKKEQSDLYPLLSPSTGGQITCGPTSEEIGIILHTQQGSQEFSELRQVLLRDNRMACLSKASNLLSINAQKSKQNNIHLSESEMDLLPQNSPEISFSTSQMNAIITDHNTEFHNSDGTNVDADASLNIKPVHTLPSSATPTLLTFENQPLVPSELIKLNCYTQFPSVPSSPNTRRRAFNFTPISPRQTPVQECLTQSTLTCSSPIQTQVSGVLSNAPPNMVSVAVGPSQPPSAASSPFVSPRSTPVPLSRSRHNSGQSAYSTPRHTPFQNFDSGVSSVSTSPFISPQSTPVPLSRLRHNSSHSQGRTVTFNTSQSIQTHSTLHGSRSRHSSGPGGPHHLMSPRSAPLSPMVSESVVPNTFTFPTLGDTPPLRSRHNSASSTTPLSPMSAPLSPNAGIGAQAPDTLTSSGVLSVDETASQSIQMIKQNLDTEIQQNKLWLNSDLLSNTINLDPKLSSRVNWQNPLLAKNNPLWPGRQRHFSGSVIHHKASGISIDSQEVQSLLKNPPGTLVTNSNTANRSRSVPLRQMLQNIVDQYSTSSTLIEDNFSKSYPATPNTANTFQFPSASSQSGPSDENMETLPSDYTSDVDLQQAASDNQDILGTSTTEEWNILSPAEDGSLSMRRNADLLEPPLEDDLQRAYDDLRDCEPDFSQFTQALEDHSVESWN